VNIALSSVRRFTRKDEAFFPDAGQLLPSRALCDDGSVMAIQVNIGGDFEGDFRIEFNCVTMQERSNRL
jgi:hypothetical protein